MKTRIPLCCWKARKPRWNGLEGSLHHSTAFSWNGNITLKDETISTTDPTLIEPYVQSYQESFFCREQDLPINWLLLWIYEAALYWNTPINPLRSVVFTQTGNSSQHLPARPFNRDCWGLNLCIITKRWVHETLLRWMRPSWVHLDQYCL